jgi:hypothetical protein
VWTTTLPRIVASSSLVRPEQHRRLLSSARPLHEEQYEASSTNNQQTEEKRRIIPKKPSPVALFPVKNKEFGRTTTEIPPTPDDLSQEPMPAVTDERMSQPTMMTYTGQTSMPLTSRLHIVTPQEDTPRGIWPVFRLMVRIAFLVFFVT